MDADGGVHSSRLRVQFAIKVSPISSVLPLEGWISSLQQLPPFNYGCLYAHLVTDSETIAENRRSTAAATFGAGAMKTKRKDITCFLMTMSGWLGFRMWVCVSVCVPTLVLLLSWHLPNILNKLLLIWVPTIFRSVLNASPECVLNASPVCVECFTSVCVECFTRVCVECFTSVC